MEFIQIDSSNVSLVVDLYDEFIKETHAGRPDNIIESAANFIASKGGFVTVVKSGNELVGFVEYRILPRKLRDSKNIVEITSLFIRSSFRSKNLGKILVDYVKKFARKNNCYSVVLYSGLELDNAHQFYEHIGFVKSAYFFKMVV